MSKFEILMHDIKFNSDGLVPVITQCQDDGEVLMMAWMNREALEETLTTRQMCYFSRSRNKLWRKGETSGQRQILKEIILDCDSDALLAKVEQVGVACHTGRRSCFCKTIKNDGKIEINQEVITHPEDLYKK